MTTSDTDAELANIREAYVRPPGMFGHYGAESRGREFDALMARVRRDAAREALDGLIAWHRENAQDSETPTPIRRGIQAMAAEAQRYRDTHYPEETP